MKEILEKYIKLFEALKLREDYSFWCLDCEKECSNPKGRIISIMKECSEHHYIDFDAELNLKSIINLLYHLIEQIDGKEKNEIT